MPDPNFEIPSRPGPRIFHTPDGNPPGAATQIEPGIGQRLGQDPGSPLNVNTAELRKFVDKDYQVVTLDLSVVRTNFLQRFEREYSFIWIPQSTNADDQIDIRIDSAGRDKVPFLAGSSLNGIPFSKLYITNLSIASATMFLFVAENWPVDQLRTDG